MNHIPKARKILCAAIAFCTLFLLSPKSEAADVYAVIASDVAQYNADAGEVYWIADAICYASAIYQVDPLLITAVMEAESHFHTGPFSSKGAIGFMQLMPGTAAAIGVNPYDPLDNVLGGASYLRTQLDSFAGYGDYAVTDAVAAYNAGPEAVRAYGGCPPYAETQNYVTKVAESYEQLLAACQS
ncbi:lytic transglycosylase domain-containing protein [uncultured Mitsuokella sp.]|uniref:lytic transglycosylase domain-containing protein n=1 Tax=uncultured Mitsuokella sp. TaxID=453120 RepID=UPI002615F964|nr:lytic transglycosylase domain-containing protein [uncultured Mitsuokella sp.]